MKCKNEDCSNEAAKLRGPDEIALFKIPFTKIEIRVWKWNSEKQEEYCDECLHEIEMDRNRELFDQAAETGYLKAVEDCRRGKWD